MRYNKLSEQDRINTDSIDLNINKFWTIFALLPFQDFNEMVKILYQLQYFNRYTLEGPYGDTPKDYFKFYC